METRALKEILGELSRPIPRQYLKTNQHENTQYFSINTYKRFLRTRAPFYSCQSTTAISGSLVVVDVSITITGSDGAVTRSANGFEQLKEKMYGDPATNAYAQAFKLACKAFGLGRPEQE